MIPLKENTWKGQSSFKSADTITAIATPSGEGGIGIVRISGSQSIKISAELFKPKKPVKEFKSHCLYYGTIINPLNNSPIDDGLLTIMKSPHSYTGEDIVEIHCHGGSLILQRVLETVLKCGARIAEPGEFTKRAFLNNKMDLAQAEAVIDIIRAKTDLALEAARKHLSGRLSEKINAAKEDLVNLLCHIEAELDFPDEEDIGSLSNIGINSRIENSIAAINNFLSTYEEGKILLNGLKAIIIGRANVGKSSLLNILLKEERAVVTPMPGTTRDIIEEVINIKGIPVRLMDTAGLRETKDAVEEIGIRFTMERLKKAQLVLFVVDAAQDDISEDLKLFEKVETGKKIIMVFNKMDIADKYSMDKLTKSFAGRSIVKISARKGNGIDELRNAIYLSAVGQSAGDVQDVIITNARHKKSLDKALDNLKSAQDAIKNDLSREFLACEIKGAIDCLGEIIGETTSDDILERIFSQFCIGK
ncbi:MAG TPA: tRNA uridine-5-carboxymethylaminomethyl(34) synthesis GTPase MnmE [Deltaproteobacteria bacterium]|nr:tRNA uridine-5-carboxymethylaminomethyl(34) synthesis GTPase MnmE [Deltaproteobacteria bacterium]